MKLTAENLEQFTALINATVRELVFMDHHANDDEMEQACDSMVQIDLNMEALREILDESAPKLAEEKFADACQVHGEPCPVCNGKEMISYGVGQNVECDCVKTKEASA